MKIRLVADTARTIAATRQTVDPGGTVDVPKQLADRLLDQPDVWAKPAVTKTSSKDN